VGRCRRRYPLPDAIGQQSRLPRTGRPKTGVGTEVSANSDRFSISAFRGGRPHGIGLVRDRRSYPPTNGRRWLSVLDSVGAQRPSPIGSRDHRRQRTVVQLFEADPALLRHLPAERRRPFLRQPLVTAYWLQPGLWRLRSASHHGVLLGVLVLDGLISREVTLAGKRGLELLGPGDLIHPAWESRSAADLVKWRVAAPARLAILDDRITKALAEIPGVLPELISRAMRRSRYLSLQLAISSIHPLPQRLHVLLWHLANRWATLDGEDVVLPMPLTHEALAELVSAQRPPVTTALAELRRQGAISRRDGDAWILHGPPPAGMRERAAAVATESL
jgi:CRP/FNR family cyclic AMP-dependent transcriptional regulator